MLDKSKLLQNTIRFSDCRKICKKFKNIKSFCKTNLAITHHLIPNHVALMVLLELYFYKWSKHLYPSLLPGIILHVQ